MNFMEPWTGWASDRSASKASLHGKGAGEDSSGYGAGETSSEGEGEDSPQGGQAFSSKCKGRNIAREEVLCYPHGPVL